MVTRSMALFLCAKPHHNLVYFTTNFTVQTYCTSPLPLLHLTTILTEITQHNLCCTSPQILLHVTTDPQSNHHVWNLFFKCDNLRCSFGHVQFERYFYATFLHLFFLCLHKSYLSVFLKILHGPYDTQFGWLLIHSHSPYRLLSIYSGTSKSEPSDKRITSHQSDSHRKCTVDHLLKRIPPNSE